MAKRKSTNNDLQNITQKTRDRVTRTTLKTGGESRCPRRLSSSCSTCGTRCQKQQAINLCLQELLQQSPVALWMLATSPRTGSQVKTFYIASQFLHVFVVVS